MKNIVLLVIGLLTEISVCAQNEIKGLITNNLGEPLDGANIFVLEQNKGTISDKEGHYLLKDIQKGKLKIQYSYIGCNNKLITVIMDNSPLAIDIILRNAPIETQAVVVIGGFNSTQHGNAVKIDVIKSEVISSAGTPNFAETLTRIPGIDMISKGSGISKPVIRGLAMNDILVLNNGVRFENYQYSDHHPLGIDEFGIESVEVIKGPASLLYGSDAIGGVIDFVKEKPAPVGHIEGDYNMKLYSNSLGTTTNLGVKGTSQNFFWGVRGGYKTNADYLQGGGDFVPNSRFNEWSLKGNAGYNGKIGIFKLFYDMNQQKLGLVESDVIPLITQRGRKNDFWYQTFNNKLLSSQNRLYLGHYKIEINAAFQGTSLSHYDIRVDPFIEMRLATLTYETKISLPSPVNTEYIIGFQGFNQHNDNLQNRETILLPDAAINNYSAFTLLQVTFLEKLKLQAGVRYDHRNLSTRAAGLSTEYNYRPALSKNYDNISGSFGTTYNLTEKLLFRANFAAAFRSPNIAELTSNGIHENRYEIGTPDLLPEHAFEEDVSIHYHADNISFDLACFKNRIKDYIFITPIGEESAGGFPIYEYRQSNSKLYGGEAIIHIHPKPVEWIHFEMAFSTVTGKKDNGDFLPLIPANKLKYELGVEDKKFMFFESAYFKINVTNTFGQGNIAPEEIISSAYTLVDLGVGANLKAGKHLIILGLSANNILNKKYIGHLSSLKEVGYFDPGRNMALNLKIPFEIR